MGWWENVLYLDRVGYTGKCICQNSINGTFIICAFHLYINFTAKRKKKRYCCDRHVEVFRGEVYQMSITLKLTPRRWVDGQVEEWTNLCVIK